MTITVNGLTIPEAADYNGTSESIYHILSASVTAYCAQEPLYVTNETFLPIRVLFSSFPASTTSPYPYNPATKGTLLLPYPPRILNLSDGLMVEAITLIRT